VRIYTCITLYILSFSLHHDNRCGSEATRVASLFSLADDVSYSGSFNSGGITKKVTLTADKTPPSINLLPGQYETSEFVTPQGGSGLITTVIVGTEYVDPGEDTVCVYVCGCIRVCVGVGVSVDVDVDVDVNVDGGVGVGVSVGVGVEGWAGGLFKTN
jgi:hypothetical protein